jgi:hypothetical protein
LLCFVDEAQTLLNEDWALSFPSSSGDVDGRPLFSEVVKTLRPSVLGPIMSGTGLSMKPALISLSGKVLKFENPVSREWTEFPALDEEACRRYLELHLGDAVQTVDHLPFILHGRPRFSAAFTKHALMNPSAGLQDVLSEYLTSWTTKQARSDPKGLYESVAKANSVLAKRAREGEAALDLFKAATVRYFVTGQPQNVLQATSTQQENDVYAFVEQGVCRLKKARTEGGGTRLQVLVDEPLVVTTACNFHDLQTFEWGLMRKLKNTTSSLGFEFEKLCVAAIASREFSLFDDKTALEGHPLLQEVRGDQGIEAFHGVWKVLEPSHPGRTLCRVESDDCKMEQWLQNPNSTFFLPRNDRGPDIVFRVMHMMTGEIVVVMIQTKLIKDNLTGKKAVHAVNTVDHNRIGLQQVGVAEQKEADVESQRVAIVEQMEADVATVAEQQKTIGIVLSYPATVTTRNDRFPTGLRSQNHLFINGCGEARFRTLFSDRFVKNLDALKH